ncbi:MAG: phosphoglucosamine mutase [Candidatus Marinimicrobia bacterium]|nr:phosphoglucosamine mutase [Candidatus Neomarinimicrobiota bacterium]
MLIRSISGIRGLVNSHLTKQFCYNFANAMHEIIPDGVIMIGRDTRPSGEELLTHVSDQLLNCGRNVITLGIVPTPTIQYMVQNTEAQGGIVITASHNPIEWNGFKFIRNDGTFFRSDECKNLFSIMDANNFSIHENDMGEIMQDVNAVQKHIINILGLSCLDINQIRNKKFNVVIDAINGAGYDALPKLLEALNCTVIPINCNPSGDFIRGAEPLPKNLKMLSETVLKTEADIGLAIDPDADRLAVVSNKGMPIGEEYTLALAADGYIKEKQSEETFVINLSTSMVLEKIANQHNCKVIRTPVGEINVVEKMIEIDAELGGEGNGGVILKESHFGRDSLVACAMVLNRLSQTNESLHDIYIGLPQFVIIKDKIKISKNVLNDLINHSRKIFYDANLNIEDGTKFTWDNKWVHLRKSNTEPIVRIYAEAKDKETAQDLIDKVKSFIND